VFFFFPAKLADFIGMGRQGDIGITQSQRYPQAFQTFRSP
jgi:hypothetical protein